MRDIREYGEGSLRELQDMMALGRTARAREKAVSAKAQCMALVASYDRIIEEADLTLQPKKTTTTIDPNYGRNKHARFAADMKKQAEQNGKEA